MKKANILVAIIFLTSVIDAGIKCDIHCKNMGYAAGGRPIGTAPACGASCKDCNKDKCTPYWSEGGGCSSGSKVCCCNGKAAIDIKIEARQREIQAEIEAREREIQAEKETQEREIQADREKQDKEIQIKKDELEAKREAQESQLEQANKDRLLQLQIAEKERSEKARKTYIEQTTGQFDGIKTALEKAIADALGKGDMPTYTKLADALEKIIKKIKTAKTKAFKDFDDKFVQKTEEHQAQTSQQEVLQDNSRRP